MATSLLMSALIRIAFLAKLPSAPSTPLNIMDHCGYCTPLLCGSARCLWVDGRSLRVSSNDAQPSFESSSCLNSKLSWSKVFVP